MSGGSEGPWVYRPNEYDDWGTVRAVNPDEDGFHRHICKVHYVASPEELCEHRKRGTDPAEDDARMIAAAPDLLAFAEWISYHYDNQDMNHVDFRVEAKRLADAAIARAIKAEGRG